MSEKELLEKIEKLEKRVEELEKDMATVKEDMYVFTEDEFVANNKLVFAAYLGVTNVKVYIIPTTAKIAIINIICNFFSQKICNNSFKSSSSIFLF